MGMDGLGEEESGKVMRGGGGGTEEGARYPCDEAVVVGVFHLAINFRDADFDEGTEEGARYPCDEAVVVGVFHLAINFRDADFDEGMNHTAFDLYCCCHYT
ncbi:hypothetical protein ACOMHN_004371 [Nucella lapillus]